MVMEQRVVDKRVMA
jgi:hypothetical protein